MEIGYCTNVHAGADLETMWDQLRHHAPQVKALHSPDTPMGIGLWLSARTAERLLDPDQRSALRDWLAREGLIPFTLNGFPYGDFHQKRVKLDVYEPNWADPIRADYTLRLAEHLDALLPDDRPGSISTVPLGWRTRLEEAPFRRACRQELLRVAEGLAQLQERRGRQIIVCLEPEPGCALDRAEHLAEWFAYLRDGATASQRDRIERHLGICHDICHSAVMRESQRHAFQTYQDAQIRVGKIQVSAAIRWQRNPHETASREAAIQLRAFAEDRYLHQTTIANLLSGQVTFYDDLGPALDAGLASESPQEWRIHFHVPIHRDRFGWIDSTNTEILDCLKAIQDLGHDVQHFEVETYAWNVLPQAHRIPELSVGIAAEMDWFRDQVQPREST